MNLILANFWEMITGANANQVIAAFTVVIGVTTIVYTLVTLRLFRLSRWSFLIDALIRITERIEEREQRYLTQMMVELSGMVDEIALWKIKRRWEQIRTEMETEPYRHGLLEAIGGVDEKLALDLGEVLLAYVKKAGEVRRKVKDELVIFRDELKGLVKEAEKREKSEGI